MGPRPRGRDLRLAEPRGHLENIRQAVNRNLKLPPVRREPVGRKT